MRKKTFPIEEVKVLLNKGFNISEIAEYFKTSRLTMSKFLKVNGLQTESKKQQDYCRNINEVKIAEEYLKGKTISDLAKSFNVSNTVIKRCLKNQKIFPRTNSEVHQKYVIYSEYFNQIDTMNKAYLLGFLCADGWVTDRNEFGVVVKTSDAGILLFFKKELKTDKEIKPVNEGEALELRLQNKHIADKLKEYGIVPRKSLILNIETVIDKAKLNSSQIKAFLLGYFDGDGGFSKSKPTPKYNYIQFSSNITGTLETCNYFKKFFNNIGFMTKRNKDEKNNYTYRIGGRNRVREAFSQLYEIVDKIDFFYKRKYDIYKEM
mgnify:CR=1 FL=1